MRRSYTSRHVDFQQRPCCSVAAPLVLEHRRRHLHVLFPHGHAAAAAHAAPSGSIVLAAQHVWMATATRPPDARCRNPMLNAATCRARGMLPTGARGPARDLLAMEKERRRNDDVVPAQTLPAQPQARRLRAVTEKKSTAYGIASPPVPSPRRAAKLGRQRRVMAWHHSLPLTAGMRDAGRAQVGLAGVCVSTVLLIEWSIRYSVGQ